MTTTRPQQARITGFTLKKTLTTASLMLGLTTAAPAFAQVQCGDTIGPNETVVLQGNVGPCDQPTGGLTVIGPATLDLNGFVLFCADLDSDGSVSTGIVIDGAKATLRNGVVRECDNGVFVQGTGKHRLTGLTATANRSRGFVILRGSHNNTVVRNSATENGDTGFVISGADNDKLEENMAVRNHKRGFGISGDRNKLSRNTASDNDDTGFVIVGGERHTLRHNTASQNHNRGFDVAGERHTLTRNTALQNLRQGIIVNSRGMGHKLSGNTADANGFAGFEIKGDQNKVQRNRAENNQGSGILLGSDAAENRISKNVALNNNQAGAARQFDLVDDSPDCGTNTWKNNTFDTSGAGNPLVPNPPCIQ